MTSQDFVDWKRHPISQAFFISITNLIQEGKDELGGTAGADPIADARKSGKIIALTDVLNTEFGEIVNE